MTDTQLLKIVAPVLLLQLTLLIVALVDLTRREADRIRGPKWVWIVVLLLGSLLGSVAYFVFGRKD